MASVAAEKINEETNKRANKTNTINNVSASQGRIKYYLYFIGDGVFVWNTFSLH